MPKTGFPTASKLLNKYEKERAYKQHQLKMQEMRHGLDNSNTRQYPHLSVSMKRLQKEEERQLLVDHQNELLVNKMRKIMTRKGRLDNWNPDYQPKSLHTPYRERQQEQIAVENMGIAKRLEKVGPVYHVKNWEDDFHRHEYILEKRAEETKEYDETITPRRQKRTAKTRQRQKVKQKDTTAEDKYEDDFESEEEDGKTETKNVGDSASNHSNQDDKIKTENQVENEKVQNDETDSKLPKIDSNGKDGEGDKDKKDNRRTSKTSPRQSQVSKLPAVSQSKKDANIEDKLAVYKDKKIEEKMKQKNKQKKALASNSKSSKSSIKQNGTSKQADNKRRKSMESQNDSSVTSESSTTRGEHSEKPPAEDPETGEFSELHSKEKTDNVENQASEDTEVREISDHKTENKVLEVNSGEKGQSSETDNQAQQEESNNGKESTKQEMKKGEGTDEQQTTTTEMNDSAENEKSTAVRDSSPSASAKSHHRDDLTSLYSQSEVGTTLADSDAKQLFRVCKELDKPDDVFIKTLVKRNHNQRMQTKSKFRDLYDLELISELRNSLGEDWHALINSMLTDRESSDASSVHNALQSGDISSIIEILCTRNTTSLNNLKEAYRKEYAISLESDFSEKTESPVQLLLLSLLKGGRSESSEVNEDDAEKEARELYESGEGRWTSDTGKFIRLIEQKNTAQFRATLNVFKQISGGKDIMVSIREDCSGQDEYIDALATLINCSKGPQMYFSEKLHGCKKLSDPSFVNVLVSRAEVDMPGTRKMYKKKYGKELADNISNKGPHPTLKVLLELVNRPPPGQSKNKAQGSKKTTSTQPATQPKKQAVKKPEKKEETQAKPNPLDRPGKRVLAEAKYKREVEERAKTKQPTQKREKTKVENDKTSGESKTGTVQPSKDFNVDKDAERLFKAMDGLGTNEEEIMDILTRRSNSQRQQIKKAYDKKYERDLIEDLKSELSGDFEELILALMMDPIVYDAYCIHDAVKGLGTDEAALVGILSTRTNQEIKAIKEQYQNVFKSDLEKDVSGDKSNAFKRMLIQLMKNESKEGDEVDEKLAEEDAKKLYKDDPKSLSVADDTLMNLLTLQNKAQIQATFNKYKEVAGHDVIEGIKLAMLGEDEEGYIGLVKAAEDIVEFHATHLKHSMTRDVGSDDKMIIRIIVSRSEIDLDKIKSKYAELYGQSLGEAVKSESGGDFCKTLLVILGDKEFGDEKINSSPNDSIQVKDNVDEVPVKVAVIQTAESSATENKGQAPENSEKGDKQDSSDALKEDSSSGKGNKSPDVPIGDNSSGTPKGVNSSDTIKGNNSSDTPKADNPEPSLPTEKDEEVENSIPKKEESKSKLEQKEKETEIINHVISEQEVFEVGRDCEQLFALLNDKVIDEKRTFEILINRTHKQRLQLRMKYQLLYRQDLVRELRNNLPPSLEIILGALTLELVEYDALCIHQAVSGIAIDDRTLVNILVSRDTVHLKAVKIKFWQVYGKDLIDYLRRITNTELGELLLVLSCLTEGKTPERETEEEIASSAQRLAMKLSSGEKAYLDVLHKKSAEHIHKIFRKYQEITGKEISESFQKYKTGEVRTALMSFVEHLNNPTLFYVHQLKEAMRDPGVDGIILIHIIVSRAEDDLWEIKQDYMKTYGVSLDEDLKSHCHADYCHILLSILNTI